MLIDDGFDFGGVGDAADGDLDAAGAGAGDADGTDIEETLEGALFDLDVANVGMIDFGGVFGEEAASENGTFGGEGEGGPEGFEPPDKQDDKAEAGGCDENNGRDEADGVGAEHGGVGLVQGGIVHSESLVMGDSMGHSVTNRARETKRN